MPLTPGTTLGPYEIQSQQGAGGMGEDTPLNVRLVASRFALGGLIGVAGLIVGLFLGPLVLFVAPLARSLDRGRVR